MPSVWIGDDADLVGRILDLHRAGPRILDATYGHGGFWRGRRADGREIVGVDLRGSEELNESRTSATSARTAARASGGDDLASPALAADRALSQDPASLPPGVVEVRQGDYTALPFGDHCFDAIMFDPPFLAHLSPGSIMQRRYMAFKTYDELTVSLGRAADEFLRVLRRRGGFVLVKAMDYTEGRRRRWVHIDLAHQWADRFRLDDILIKVGVANPRTTRWQRQQRSKSAHTYFMVFRPHGERLSFGTASSKASAQRLPGDRSRLRG